MQGIHSLGQLQSPLFIRLYTHLHHVCSDAQAVGFLTSNMKVIGPHSVIYQLFTYQNFPSHHSFSLSLCS